jgi:predicted transcriptional regulator
MQTRRTRLEILLGVLNAIKDGETKPTRIMYATNMSWTPTKKILTKLIDQGFIDVSEEPSGGRSKKRYDINEKGMHVLRYFNGAQELLYI